MGRRSQRRDPLRRRLPGTCGNGIVEHDEECDGGSCCTAQCTDASPGELCGNPCNTPSCQISGGQIQCLGGPPLAGCSQAGSATGPLPGTLATPDQSVTLTIPNGVGAARAYGIAGGLSSSQFNVGTEFTRVLVAELLPDGATFAPPGATIAFRWKDTNGDGVVDGTGVEETVLRIFHDGQPITPTCSELAAVGCTNEACCIPGQNVFSVQVTSFSEFVVAADEPDASTTTTTATSPGVTTTTLPACSTMRCLLDEARNAPACAGTLPSAVARKLDGAVSKIELAPSQAPKKATKLYKAGKRLLGKGAKAVEKAARGRRPKLGADCAAKLREAIGIAIGRVGTS